MRTFPYRFILVNIGTPESALQDASTIRQFFKKKIFIQFVNTIDLEKFRTDLWTFLENNNIMLWIIICTVLLAGFIFLFRKRQERRLLNTVTKPHRGTRTERDLVLKLLKNKIPAKTIFHDLYVKNYNGKFSQIDLVVATRVGIIVFEVKDFIGWIFGNGNHSHWTKVLAYGKDKYRFYNPIMQNNKHIQDLKKQLKQFKNIPFYSIIVFYGDCVLKEVNFIPNGTYLVKPNRVIDVLKIITTDNEPANYTDKWEVIRVLEEAVMNGENVENQIQHIENIEDMLGKDRIFD
jgi:LPXTG-motif cell wall-anchored protein